MYEFRDTIDHTDLVDTIPSEAMNFGGVFLENEVEGYKTLTVTGREPLSRNIQAVKIGRSDGDTFKSSSLDSREIQIKFAIFTSSPEDYQLRLTELKSLLYVGETEIWFNDDKTRGITGFVSAVNITSEGNVIVRGNIVIFCPNPNWYSLIETKVTATNGIANIDYPNSYLSKPRIAVNMHADNGYVGIIDSQGNVLQFGTAEEIDGVIENKSVVRVSDIVANDFNAGNIAQRGWTYNNAGFLLDVNGKKPVQTGEWEFGYFDIYYGKWKGTRVKVLTPKSFGPNTTDSYHGPSMTRKFTQLASLGNKDTAKDFSFTCEMNFIIGATPQVGTQQWTLNTKDNKNVAGIVIFKNILSDNQTSLQYWINGRMVYSTVINPVTTDLYTGWDGGSWSIDKMGNKITFGNRNHRKEFTIDTATEALEAHSITAHIGVWANAGPASTVRGSAVTHNHVRSIRFTQHNVQFWNDIPNRFGDGDLLVIDTATGSVLLNGLPNATLGALGNDWEKFGLVSGENKITFLNSNFSTPAPTYDIYYRGVDV